MKKLLLLLAPLTLGLMVGCSYDDSAILDKITELEKEQDEMQKEQDEMQAQIDALQALLDALANKLTITAVTQNDNGYTITFSDGSSMTIKNGEQGEKGDKGDNGEKGEQGDSFIESIVVGEEDVTFTLTDGTVIVIPLGSDSGDTSSEDNKIYYTTSDNTKLFPKTDVSLYGAILISNTYNDGQGILVFDDAVTMIGSSAFSGCTSLTSITIPDSVTSIGGGSSLLGNGGAFYGCSSLTSITIPDSVTSIGDYAFYGCSSLTSVTIGNGVTSIGKYAFENCSSLTSVTMGNGVTSIGGGVFGHCTSLTSITIPDGITSIGGSAFYGCSSLTSVTMGNGVTSIGGSAFYGCSSLTSITIPNSVTSIGYMAFAGCTSLKSVTIPDSVTEIGERAFENSTGELILNCSCLGLYGGQFTKVVIGNGVTSIGEDAFRDCSSLTSVTIPDSITWIGESAFSGCSSLTSVYITDIAAWCRIGFDNPWANPLLCANNLYLNGELLTELIIPDSVTSIGNYAFDGCSSLTSITIPDSVTSIGNGAFSYCSSLTSLYITDISAWCGITFNDLNANPLYYTHNLYLNGELLTELIIPDSVTSIEGYTFYGCTSLTSVTIPDSVTSIGGSAFSGCSSLTSITIPDSVTSIGGGAFWGCSSLTEVYCKPTTPPSGRYNMFYNNASGRKIYVPTKSVGAYKTADYWDNYASSIEGYDFE